jgi:hypothetical protein
MLIASEESDWPHTMLCPHTTDVAEVEPAPQTTDCPHTTEVPLKHVLSPH